MAVPQQQCPLFAAWQASRVILVCVPFHVGHVSNWYNSLFLSHLPQVGHKYDGVTHLALHLFALDVLGRRVLA